MVNGKWKWTHVMECNVIKIKACNGISYSTLGPSFCLESSLVSGQHLPFCLDLVKRSVRLKISWQINIKKK